MKKQPTDLSPKYQYIPTRDKVISADPVFGLGQTIGGLQVDAQQLSQGKIIIQGVAERILIGDATGPFVGKGIFLGSDQAATVGYDFRAGDPAGNYIYWDASAATLTIVGSLTATSGTIGGFTISATTIAATNLTLTSGAANTANIAVGTGSNLAGLNSGNSASDIAFWSGSTFANRATAPFRVDLAGNLTATSATLSGYVVSTKGTFGGDGSDGALAVSSGTTTLSFASASFLVKNYSSIAITGTGKLATSTPATTGSALVLKSQGAVTITSSTAPCIDLSSMGAAGGAGLVGSSGGNGADGSNGGVVVFATNKGSAAAGTGGPGGSGTVSSVLYPTAFSQHMNRYPLALVGSGGGSGDVQGSSTGNASSGSGGTGGGCLIIECAGAWNFTTAGGISVGGGNGGNGTASSANHSGGGGGGGSGGFIFVLYNTLTANSGTTVVTGGTGGNKDSFNVVTSSGGGGGGFLSAGSSGGSSAAASAKTGGDGAVGLSTIVLNGSFA